MRDAIRAFSRKEKEAEAKAESSKAPRAQMPRKQDIKEMSALGIREPPEQRLARLQMEIGELFKIVDSAAATKAPATDYLGDDPARVKEDLKELEQRLVSLVK